MARMLILVIVIQLIGCASSRVWVLSRNSDSGIIAYENYNPKSDGGKRLKDLIPCENYRITDNPIYRISNGNSGYYYGGGIIVPLDGGYTERAELHYVCESPLPTTDTQNYSNSKIFNCEKNCREVYAASPISDLNYCLQKNCK